MLGIGFLLVALLTLPLAQKNSSAHETTTSSKTGATLSPLSIPNDTCATSVPLQLGIEVNGTLVSAVDDYELSGAGCFTGIGQSPVPSGGSDAVYSFTAPATATYSFKVTDPVPGNFVLYTASTCPAATPGTPVIVDTCQNASNRSPVQASEEVLCQPMSAGETVYIFVDQVINGATTFKIQVTRCNYETEPNNTPATANPFIFGVEGSINPGTDVDFFSLGTPPAGSRVFALLDGSASNGSNYQLRVTTSTDTLEFDDDNATFLFGNVAPAIAGTPLTGVPSFLRIDSAASTAREPYRLYAVVEPETATAVPESEPNNSLATANSNPLGYFSGSITAGATADVDFYSFGAAAGDLIFIALDNDPQRDGTPFNGDVALVDSSNTVLYAADDVAATSNTSSGAGSLSATTPFSPADALVYRIQASGTYYARVSSSGIGDYLLAISNNGNGGPTAANGVVSGRVRGVDGSPIGGVVVALNGNESRRTITDSDGNYRF
ncbi:MAG TPA: carboxypeptidase-like regulatory domain-containing protein, partial [Pyrinomonadaceae bacterium]